MECHNIHHSFILATITFRSKQIKQILTENQEYLRRIHFIKSLYLSAVVNPVTCNLKRVAEILK